MTEKKIYPEFKLRPISVPLPSSAGDGTNEDFEEPNQH